MLPGASASMPIRTTSAPAGRICGKAWTMDAILLAARLRKGVEMPSNGLASSLTRW
jgi:hypothetical protein